MLSQFEALLVSMKVHLSVLQLLVCQLAHRLVHHSVQTMVLCSAHTSLVHWSDRTYR